MKKKLEIISLSLGLSMSLSSLAAKPETANLFRVQNLSSGYANANVLAGQDSQSKPFQLGQVDYHTGSSQESNKDTDRKCGSGKCGGDKDTSGKCGSGKCGGDKDTSGKCGSGKCGGDKDTSGKCGAGKCG